MTECDYESRFLDQLIESYDGGSWREHVRKWYELYMAAEDERRIEKWEIERL